MAAVMPASRGGLPADHRRGDRGHTVEVVLVGAHGVTVGVLAVLLALAVPTAHAWAHPAGSAGSSRRPRTARGPCRRLFLVERSQPGRRAAALRASAGGCLAAGAELAALL